MPLLGPVLGHPILSLWGSSNASALPPIYGGAAALPRGYPHLTLYDELPCLGGVPLRRLYGPATWGERERLEAGWATGHFNLELPTPIALEVGLVDDQIVRVVRGPGQLAFYILTQVADGLNDDGLTKVTGQSIESLLAELGEVRTDPAIGSTFVEALQHILDETGLAGWITLGTVTPAALLEARDVAMAGQNAAAAFQLVHGAAIRLEGAEVELALVPNGHLGFLLHLTETGGTAATVDLPYGPVLQGISRERTRNDRLTRAMDPGSGQGLPYLEVVALTGTTVDVVMPHRGPGIAIESGQWDPWTDETGASRSYVLIDPAGTAHGITGTAVVSAEITRFTVATTTGISVGHQLPLAEDGAGTPTRVARLPSLDNGRKRPILRRISGGATPDSNLFLNGEFARWTSLGPDGYTGTGLTTSRSTVPGSHIVGGAACQLDSDIDRSVGQVAAFWAPAAGFGIHYWVRFKPVSNSQWALMTWKDPTTGGDVSEAIPLLDNGRFHEISRSFLCPPGPVTLQQIVINNGGGTAGQRASLYVDAFSVNWGSSQALRLEGSGPSIGLQAANLALLRGASRMVRYTVRPWDVAALDPDYAGRWRTLPLGGRARLIGRPLGIDDTVRAVEIHRPGANPAGYQVQLALQEPSLADLLGGRLG